MLQRLFGWFKDQKSWKADHLKTWNGLTLLDSEGISKFQRLALSTIESHGIQLPFERNGESEAYFVAQIQGTDIEVFIYSDGAQVAGKKTLLRAEEWDYRTPEELLQTLISVLFKNVPAA